jgi:hypothetical protein
MVDGALVSFGFVVDYLFVVLIGVKSEIVGINSISAGVSFRSL